ncbi:TspO/MBR family protein [Devriesea agamarum]|uniref:TspO/MBR family protein n=1 Tax=Devriesea agamarum TaxID=472569 RepID=UPI00071D6A8A|nr:TspO/MBR family protein [Devriesea agamarum]
MKLRNKQSKNRHGSSRRPWVTALLTTGAVAAAAGIGTAVTDADGHWYRNLKKPSWQPPRIAFPVVWTGLYGAIAWTSTRTLNQLDREGRDKERRAFSRALGANLALNAGWSVLFFGAHKLRAARVESVVLAASSADLVRRVGAASSGRGVLLAPYAAWTAFAAYLTHDITRRNADSHSG